MEHEGPPCCESLVESVRSFARAALCGVVLAWRAPTECRSSASDHLRAVDGGAGRARRGLLARRARTPAAPSGSTPGRHRRRRQATRHRRRDGAIAGEASGRGRGWRRAGARTCVVINCGADTARVSVGDPSVFSRSRSR